MGGHNGTERNEVFDRFVYPQDLRLPTDCPYRLAEHGPDETPGRGFAQCCRRRHSRQPEEPLCVARQSEDEAYRFVWEHSFGEHARVRVGWYGETGILNWSHAPGIFSPARNAEQRLSPADRARLLAALAAAKFWTCDAVEARVGLDGAHWLIEGRRGDRYRRWVLWSPDGAFERLGRVFFDLAGQPLADIRP